VGVSLIDHRPRELLYMYLRDITLVNIQKATTDEILLTIAECQVGEVLNFSSSYFGG
jgi:hypothetical protein